MHITILAGDVYSSHRRPILLAFKVGYGCNIGPQTSGKFIDVDPLSSLTCRCSGVRVSPCLWRLLLFVTGSPGGWNMQPCWETIEARNPTNSLWQPLVVRIGHCGFKGPYSMPIGNELPDLTHELCTCHQLLPYSIAALHTTIKSWGILYLRYVQYVCLQVGLLHCPDRQGLSCAICRGRKSIPIKSATPQSAGDFSHTNIV